MLRLPAWNIFSPDAYGGNISRNSLKHFLRQHSNQQSCNHSHNIGQLLVAIPATHTVGLLYYYAPALMVSGVITGLLIGVLTKEVLKRIP